MKKGYDSTKIYRKTQKKGASQTYDTPSSLELFSHQKTNLTEMTMTEFDRIFVVTKELHYFINHKKSLFMYFTYTQQLTALFLAIFDLFCLTSHHGFEQTAEKCIIFAEEKQHSAI